MDSHRVDGASGINRLIRNTLPNPLVIGLPSFCGYSLATLWYTYKRWGAPSIFGVSVHPYFNYLADSFWHGLLYLRVVPASTLDLVYYNLHCYLYWPPFPAIPLMPFVKIIGLGFSDILFNLLIAAADVGLTAAILKSKDFRSIVPLTPFKIALLSLFFAFGTVHLFIVFRGEAWYTSQLVAHLRACRQGAGGVPDCRAGDCFCDAHSLADDLPGGLADQFPG